MNNNQTENAQNPVDSAMAAWRNNLLPIVLLAALVGGLAVVLGGAVFRPHYDLAPALIWSLGFCACGMLLGFLFGIPRTLTPGTINIPAGSMPTDAPEAGAGDPTGKHGMESTAPYAHNEINSNLVEVSDWLTKIIVGVGLVELKNLPGGAQSVAEFIAPSLGTGKNIVPIAGGMMLYFSVLGFLIGYLLTRIYLAIIIKRADNLVKIQNDPIRLASGKEIEVRELTKLQQSVINDLQETVSHLVLAKPINPAATTAAAVEASPGKRMKRRILWVDDNPGNNTLLVEQFELIDIGVKQVVSTSQALDEVRHAKYDLIITDMARTENGQRVQNAGVLVIGALKPICPGLQSVVYCSRGMARLYGNEAEQAGARLVTTSGTTLLAEVRRIFDAAP